MRMLYTIIEDKFKLKNIKDYYSQKLLLKRVIVAASLKVQNKSNVCFLSNLQLKTIIRFNEVIENHFKSKNEPNGYTKFLNKQPVKFTSLLRQYFSEPLLKEKKEFFLRVKKILSFNKKATMVSSANDEVKFYYPKSFQNFENNSTNIIAQNLNVQEHYVNKYNDYLT